MEFTKEEVFYLKRLLENHVLDLVDLKMNGGDKYSISNLARINESCMLKLESYEESELVGE